MVEEDSTEKKLGEHRILLVGYERIIIPKNFKFFAIIVIVLRGIVANVLTKG